MGSVKSKNYFIRHCIGDFPLAASFWVNGIAVSLVVVLIFYLANQINVAESPVFYSLLIISIWLLVLALNIWQMVGIWRSANNYANLKQLEKIYFWQYTKEIRWDNAAKIIVVFFAFRVVADFIAVGVPQIYEYWQIASGDESKAQIHLSENNSVLEIEGAINFVLSDELNDSLKKYPTVKMININSTGGRVSEARKLADIIERKNLSTTTTQGCYSACIIVYAAGKERHISKNAELGFHQYSFPATGQEQLAIEYQNDKKYLRSKGIEENFIDHIFSIPNSTLWKPSVDELLKANFITNEPE